MTTEISVMYGSEKVKQSFLKENNVSKIYDSMMCSAVSQQISEISRTWNRASCETPLQLTTN